MLEWPRKRTELLAIEHEDHPSAAKAALICRTYGTAKDLPFQSDEFLAACERGSYLALACSAEIAACASSRSPFMRSQSWKPSTIAISAAWFKSLLTPAVVHGS